MDKLFFIVLGLFLVLLAFIPDFLLLGSPGVGQVQLAIVIIGFILCAVPFVLDVKPWSAIKARAARSFIGRKEVLLGGLIIGFVTLSLAVVAEGAFRILGFVPLAEQRSNDWQKKEFRICDKIEQGKLEILDTFYTDEKGIFKANRGSKHFRRDVSINSDGFRGNPFIKQTEETTILFIGDSFTWGASATPITNSFVDIVDRIGFYTYNAGIGGTDSIQYLNIAQEYVPRLGPDVVAVIIYMGNDVRGWQHLYVPNKPVFFVTNEGWVLNRDKQGNLFDDAGSAIKYLKRNKCHRYFPTDFKEYFFFETSWGSLIYNYLESMENAYSENASAFYTKDEGRDWIKNSLHRIKELVEKQGGKFFLFIIPVKPSNSMRGKNDIHNNLYIFEGLNPFYPQEGYLDNYDYMLPPNDHFNNEGHAKYARFILGILRQHGYKIQGALGE